MAFTKVVGAGIHTLSNIHSHNINSSGIITATKFIGPITGAGGDFNAGIVTATSLDVNGNGDISGNLVVGGNLTANGDFTTLNTTLREVELLRVESDSGAIAGIITQSGSGHALYVDGTTILGNSQYVPSFSASTQLAVANLSGNSNSVDMTILGGRLGKSIIRFGDHDSNNRGSISYQHTNDSLNFFTNGSSTEKLTIASDGNVGIGTDNPNSRLHIWSTGPDILLTDSNQAANNRNWVLTGANTQILRIQAQNDSYAGGGNLFDFYRSGNQLNEFRGMNGGNYWFTINNNTKKVGINSTNPANKLDIGLGAAWIYPDEDGTEAIALKLGKLADYNTSLNDILVADNDGSSSPTYRVTSKINRYIANWHFDRADPTGRINGIQLRSHASGGHVGNTFIIRDLKNTADSVKLWSNGNSFVGVTTDSTTRNFGIGTNNPTSTLHVNGSLKVVGFSTFTNELQITPSNNSAYTTHLNYNNTGTNYISHANGGATVFRNSTSGGTAMVVQGSNKAIDIDGLLRHIDDTDTFMEFGDNTISFDTGNVERLQLDGDETTFNSTGADTDFRVRTPAQTHMFYVNAGTNQVCVKTSSAASGAELTVNGRTHTDTQFTIGSNSTLDASVQATIYKPATNTLAFATAGANERLRIDNVGRIQIGSTNDTGYNDFDGIGLLNLNNNNPDGTVDYTQGIVFTNNDSNEGTWTQAAIVSTGSGGYNGNLIFATDGTGARDNAASNFTERLRITSSGYLKHTGLRAGNNQNKLAILTTPSYDTNEQDVVLYIAENEANMNQISFGGGTSAYNAVTKIRFLTTAAVDGTTGTERVRIDEEGRLQIGSSISTGYNQFNGPARLTIQNNSADGTVNFAQGIIFTDNTSGAGTWTHGGIVCTGSSGYNGNLIFGTDGGGSKTNTASGITERMRITHDGKVGIGDNNPANTLVVKTIPTIAHSSIAVHSSNASTKAAMQTVQDSEIRLGGTSAGHPLQLYAGGSAQITVGPTGGFQFNQGNNNSPTYFNGGSSNARNYVNVKAGNTNSGSYSGFGIINSSNSATWQFQVEHNGDDLDIFGNSAGGRLRFWTKDDGASSSTIKMQLTQGGFLDAKPQKGNTGGSAYNMIPRGRSYEWNASNLSPSSPYESGWYTIMDISDGVYMFWIGTNAHSSALITVCNGYDNSRKSTINCLHYCYNPNSNYLNIEKARVTKTGLVQVYLYASNPAYFSMYIQMISNDSVPNFQTTLTKDTSSQQVDHELDMKATGSSYNGMMQVKHMKVEDKFLMGTTGSIDMGFGPQVMTVRGGATAGYDGTAAAVFGQTDNDASCVLIYGSDGSYGSNLIDVRVARSGSSSYNFAIYKSGGAADNEFIFRGDGNAFQDGGTTFSTPADYAEYFEWSDGNSANEDRRGMTVVLDGNKVKVATSSDSTDNIIGVVSGNPAVVGDGAWNKWAEKYLKDDFNNYILDSNGHRQLNPSYDSTKVYTPRAERQEWDAIGMVGKLRIRKGQQTGTRWIKMRDISDSVEEWLVR